MENKYLPPEEFMSKFGDKSDLYNFITIDCKLLSIKQF